MVSQKCYISVLGNGITIENKRFVACVIRKDGLFFDGFISTGYKIMEGGSR